MEVQREVLTRMIEAAKTAAARAYCPYSRFRVGAAVLGADGKIYDGCNVENASYGLSNCAERVAIGKLVSSWESNEPRSIVAVVVYTPTSTATPPCGACRQVINEFGPNAVVVSVCGSDHRVETTLGELLPGAFGPHNLA